MPRVSLGLVFVLATATSASADRPKLDLRVGKPAPELPAFALSGHTIYLNPCVGGCMVNPGDDDATANPPRSAIPNQPSLLPEYDQFQPGEWEATVQCVKEVYSPFNVTVTDVRPPAGTVFSMIMVGGTAEQPGGDAIGAPGSGGVAIVSGNCAPIIRGVSYAFTDQLDIFAQEIGGSRPLALCWIIAQETAHSFGLDHEFEFTDDGRSACNDPMTYRDDCGGQKFFRNKFAVCGEFPGDGQSPRDCRCGANQNSHLKLLNTFGAGTSLIPAPTVAVTNPAASSDAANSLPANVIAQAGSKRGVEKVELYLNGFKWAEAPGAQFGRQGQLDPSSYGLLVPTNQIPDSVYDVQVKAYDDLGLVSESAVVTVTKGAAGGCVSADSCLKGQKCEQGRCFWDPPAGEIGDTCDFPQFCKTGLCQGTAEEQICTQSCIVGVEDSCPADQGLTCVATNGPNGICFFAGEEGGGCCSTSDQTPWAPFGLGAAVFGLVAVRRRRRR